MGLFASLFESRSTSRHPRDPVLAEILGGFANTSSGISVTPDSSLREAAVYACIRFLSESVAKLPLHVYRRRKSGGKDKATDHPLYEILRYSPNRRQTSYEFRQLVSAMVELRGNSCSVIVPAGGSAVGELIPLEPDRMTIFQAPDGRRAYRYWPESGGEIVYLQDEIFHVMGMSFDGIAGLSPIAYHRETVGSSLAIKEFGARLFSNGTHIGTIIEHPGKISAPAKENLKDSLSSGFASVVNAGKAMILEEGMKLSKLGMTSEDAQYLESRKFGRSEIASIFGVPPHKIGDLEKATFCLPASTLVMTSDGPKPIAEVCVGQEVWSLDGKSWVRRQVMANVMSGVDPIIEIKTTNRTLRCNAQHRVLVRRKHAAPKVGRGGYQCVEWKNEYVEAGELEVGDTLIAMHGLPDTGSNKTPTRYVSEGFMEFCGLLIGDGNVFDWGVSIARAETAQYMDHYRKVIINEFFGYDGGNGRGDNTAVALRPVNLQEGGRQTRFSSVIAAKELRKLGFSGNARTKRVPAWVYTLSNDLKLAFIRGYLDSDGSVDKKGRISFLSVSRELIDGVRHLCMSVGVPVTNIRHSKGETTLPDGERKEFSAYTFTCSDPGANRMIGSNDPRYVERLKNGKEFSKKNRNYPRYGGRGFDLDGFSLSKIVSIKTEAPEPVYDITVDGTHNFVADGVVVHNSNIEQQSIEFVTDCLMPRLVRFEEAVSRDLISPADRRRGYFAEFNVMGLLRGDADARSKYYSARFATGSITPNQIRAHENENPEDGGDTCFVPLNMIPIEMAGKHLETPPGTSDEGGKE